MSEKEEIKEEEIIEKIEEVTEEIKEDIVELKEKVDETIEAIKENMEKLNVPEDLPEEKEIELLDPLVIIAKIDKEMEETTPEELDLPKETPKEIPKTLLGDLKRLKEESMNYNAGKILREIDYLINKYEQ